jgi:hypothetical protein
MRSLKGITAALLGLAVSFAPFPGLWADDEEEPVDVTAATPALLPVKVDTAFAGYDDSCVSVVEPCASCLPLGYWVRAEYLLWWTDGMVIPPLVTQGTTPESTGALDDPTSRILYGGDQILDDARSGFRVGLGTWLDCGRSYGVEGDYWLLGSETARFYAASNEAGSPCLFRPFFNVNPRDVEGELDPPARPDAEVVSTPELLAGAVEVKAFSELQGAGIRLRRRLCGEMCCDVCCGSCKGAPPVCRTSRFDFLLGYRYVRLRERLGIREDLTSLLGTPEQGDFDIDESFGTTNNFNGVDLGVSWLGTWGPWSLEMLGRLALGNVRQAVRIRGQTVISNSEFDDGTYEGGLLALQSNIGGYDRDKFAVVPELGLTLGYDFTPCLRATVGYTFLYWSRVVRPGQQIDLDVNPDLIPPPGFESPVGPLRPAFVFRDTDFWAQGLNVGLLWTW